MLDDTLVGWAREFGRTPIDQFGNVRDHNPKGFTIWLAGATDKYGREAVEGRVHIHDLHATILHLLGLDHEKLTYRYSGRDFLLTNVHGRIVNEILV